LGKNPEISVVMSAYNSAGLIQRAIDSILGQTFDNFELIILDDGSTDGTADVVRANTDKRIRLILLQHAGLPVALNHGISVSEAPLIARHDSDDFSHHIRLEKQLAEFSNNPNLDVVATWHHVVDEMGHFLGLKKTVLDDSSLKAMLARRNPFAHGTVMMKKAAVVNVGGYNERLFYSQDYDLWLRIAHAGLRFKCIPESLYNYSISPDSIARGWTKLSYAGEIRKNSARVTEEFTTPIISSVSTRRKNALWNYAIGSLALENGRRCRASKFFRKSLMSDPTFWRAGLRLGLSILPHSFSERLSNLLRRRR
tara:strand:- start:2267 stop:3199 length:933 start_codon:yes stop_codon:yes gene_type:complete